MPNIAIYEGGKAARMNGVSLITTDDGEDGKVTWVPQSDRQTGTLHVSENGTYRAEDEGLHSWSKVTVRLAGAPLGLEVPTLPDPITGVEIPTGEIGLEEPVPPAGLEPFDEEPISSDEAESILEDAGLDPSDLDPDSPNYDDAMEAIGDALGTDPDSVKVVDTGKKEDVKEAEPKVEDKGQEATGIDPATGEQTTITPSGKEGAIVPDELRIVSPPSRTSYEDGDTIDYSGISCALYKNGQFIRNATFDELSFPVTTATYDGNKIELTDEDGLNVWLVSATPAASYYQRDATSPVVEEDRYSMSPYLGTGSSGYPVGVGGQIITPPDWSSYHPAIFSVYMTRYNGALFVKLSSGEFVWAAIGIRPEPDESSYPRTWGAFQDSIGGATVTTDRYTEVGTLADYFTNVPESTKDPRLEGSRPLIAEGQKQSLPVEWSGGSTSLGSSFDIMVYYDNV